ncbi:MAG: biotin/lipoyl-binding protein [Planctomycetia bacterium]|nr:biotin/lipoyl-binding protein [Planctomycetia bacterium]
MVALTKRTSSAATERPLALRTRLDLVARRNQYQGDVAWIVKDPLALSYFRFREEEYALLQLIDGHSSLAEIKQRFEAQFVPRRISVEEIARFAGNLYRSGLVVADMPGQAEQLRKRQDETTRRRWLTAFGNILSIRVPLLDPDRLLEGLHRLVGWFFSPLAVAASVMLMLSAVMLVAMRFDLFMARMPAFHQFFARENWIYLALALAATKVLHEFGHGLACKHFGGECHEMGAMLLIFTPCLYCNVSDSWLLKSKWQRAAVGAAGMYVELVLASIATFLWWASVPGMLNQLCLCVMFISSVSTLMFNANPLLRYDGYYILADVLEIPNLRQKATSVLQRALATWCLGLEAPDDPLLPQRRLGYFALYAVAAAVYGWVVTISILWFLNKVFRPYGLQVVGQALAMVAVGSMLIMPLWRLAQYLRVPGRIQQVKTRNAVITLSTLGAVGLGVLLIPLPQSVHCTVEIQPRDAANVYAEVPGALERIHVAAGQTVKKGDLLGELSNPDVMLEEARLAGQEAEATARLASLDTQRHTQTDAGNEARGLFQQVKQSLESVRAQHQLRQRDVERLKLVATVDGTVLPPPAVTASPAADGRLPAWSGSPLEERNLGAVLGATPDRALFCRIGDPHRLAAVLVIDQQDIELVQPGQNVRIQIDQLPGETFNSTVDTVAQKELTVSSRRMSSKTGGGLMTQTDAGGNERPLSASYQAKSVLNDDEGVLRIGARGRALIAAAPQTLGTRLWRYLGHTFEFQQ